VAELVPVEADLSCLRLRRGHRRSLQGRYGTVTRPEGILAAFAAFIVVLVKTLPGMPLAGVIALGGVWIINHLDDSLVHLPTAFQLNSQ
jgi:hypothetical protein